MTIDIYAEAQDLVRFLRAGSLDPVNQKEIKAIGQKLWDEGGIDRMRDVAYIVRGQYPNGEGGENGWHPGEIDGLWSGIGSGSWVW